MWTQAWPSAKSWQARTCQGLPQLGWVADSPSTAPCLSNSGCQLPIALCLRGARWAVTTRPICRQPCNHLLLSVPSSSAPNSTLTPPTLHRLGHLGPPSKQPFNYLSYDVIASPEHHATARHLLQQGIVLLKNSQNTLPLKVAELRKVAIIGPFADDEQAILGNYFPTPNDGLITPLEPIRKALPSRIQVSWDASTSKGCSNSNAASDVARCKGADACILFLGSRIRKGEDTPTGMPRSDWYAPMTEGENQDRTSLLLNSNQRKLVQVRCSCVHDQHAAHHAPHLPISVAW
ncbi:hypothetical protein ABPG75_008222 [Micractinium tetrahymenae]